MQERGPLRVQSQGRAYIAVLGVTVGMLVAGLAVPLAFGHAPGDNTSSNSAVPNFSLTPAPGGSGSLPGTTPLPGGSASLPGTAGGSGAGNGGGAQPGGDASLPASLPSTGGALPSGGGSLPSAGGSLPGGGGGSLPTSLPSSQPGGGQPGTQPGTQPSGGGQTGGQPTTQPSGGGQTGGQPSSQPSGGGQTGGQLTASDQGVTPTSVKIGVVVLDIQALTPLGFGVPHFSPQEQQKAFQAFFDDINKSGGISGRKIDPVYVTLNALDSNGDTSPGAVCTKLGEDDKVFAVMGFMSGNLPECLAEQYHIPVLSDQGRSIAAYQKTPGYIVSYKSSYERGAADWGDLAVRSGILSGRKIGTVYMDGTDNATEASLTGALQAGGVSVTVHGKLASDAATAQSQIPIVVNQMRTAGINTVMLTTNFVLALQFVQTAQQQNFDPQYVVSDYGSLTVDGLVSDMPSSFNGAIGFTSGNSADHPAQEDLKCLAEFNKQAHENYSIRTVGAVTAACFFTRVLSGGASVVGGNLTRPSLATAFQRLGSPALPQVLGGSFASGKTDYADYFRPVTFATSCKCYHDAGGAQKGKY